MQETSVSQVLLERLTSTNGFASRRSGQDDVFWYTSGKPGPFYINTENIAGEHEAGAILAQITSLLKEDAPRAEQAKAIAGLILQAAEADPAYQASIDALADYYRTQRSGAELDYISGGERRDWFFSIPIAAKLQIPHVFLFKAGDFAVTDPSGNELRHDGLQGRKVLHVADIINQASSYTARWIPILRGAGASFTETLTVAVRSQEGIERLNERQVAVVSPLIVDKPLFAEARALELISEFAYNEIMQYYQSAKDWARSYLSSANLDDLAGLTPAGRERVAMFRSTDPYALKEEFPNIFA